MKLIIENWLKFINEQGEKKNISYSAVMIDEESINKLKEKFDEYKPENFVYEAKDYPLPHHMTITMGALGKYSESYPNGETINLKVVGYGISNDAMAIEVEPPSEINSKSRPHITFALPPNGKPFLSNKIENWKSVEETFDISGTVEEVPQK